MSFAAQSDQVTPLIVGSVVTAFELHLNEDGNQRIRCEGGWCNVVSSDGTVLMEAM